MITLEYKAATAVLIIVEKLESQCRLNLVKVGFEMYVLPERMFSIGGNLPLSSYKDTMYEPLELVSGAQEEVR